MKEAKINNTDRLCFPELYRTVASQTGVTIQDSRIVCEAFLGAIVDGILDFRTIVLSGYFNLEPSVRKSRPVVQWGTDKVINSCEAPQVKFVPCKDLKKVMRDTYARRKQNAIGEGEEEC